VTVATPRSERAARGDRVEDEELERVVREVRAALSQIRYGSVEIVVQDSRVVQIERREKVRFDRERERRP
jgi:hypothetical protein